MRCRETALFNWLILGAIFENLTYKILSLFQQSWSISTNLSAFSQGKWQVRRKWKNSSSSQEAKSTSFIVEHVAMRRV